MIKDEGEFRDCCTCHRNATPLRYTDPTGEIVPLVVVGGFAVRALIGAGIETGLQAGKIWYQGCDVLDFDNYNKSSIVGAGVLGGFVPGPGGPAWKHLKEWLKWRKVEKSINRPEIEAAKRAFKRDAAFQAGRAAVGVGIKRGLDEIERAHE